MKKMTAGWLVAMVSAASLLAHHSLGNYDTTKAVRVKGTIVQLQQINPHSILFVDGTDADGQSRRWAIEGPSVVQLKRTGFVPDTLKPGTAVEACGYLPKETITWQIANPDPTAVSMAGRLMNGEMLRLADRKEQSWGDYGVHKCFSAGYTDQHQQK